MDIVKELLLKEKDTLEARLTEVKRVLAAYNIEDPSSAGRNNSEDDGSDMRKIAGFPKSGTMLQQIFYVIKANNRFLHNSEITEEFFKQGISKDRKWLRRRISAVLSHAKKEQENLISFQFSKSLQDTVWGNKAWLNENGEVKPEHMYAAKEKNVQEKIDF